MIVRFYCDQIINGPSLKADDSKGLNSLARLLTECSVTFK